MKTLSNDKITLQISEAGAELISIAANNTEYLWQADPQFWGRHSPVLFPIVGRVWDNQYKHEGKTYHLSQHGFARDMQFQISYEEEEEHAVVFSLESNEDTLAKYPFPFVLEIGYRLIGNKIEVMWNVQNTGDKEMHFQIGAHPAFNYRDFDALHPVHAYLGFGTKSDKIEYICPVEKGCVSPQRHALELQDGLMEITPTSFGCDTYIFDNSQVNRLTLLDRAKKPYISLQFNTPLVAVWSPSAVHPDVPFICLEPWYGRCDRVGYKGEFKDRDWMQHVQPGKSFAGGYSIIIEDVK